MDRARTFKLGFYSGLIAGLSTIALMYVLGPIFALQPLPQVLQQPLLNVLPGAVFGFLIDSLQHWGKIVEEISLILLLLTALGLLGVLYAHLRFHHPFRWLNLAFSGALYLITVLVLLPLAEQGWLGLSGGLQVPFLYALFYTVYALILEATFNLASISPVAESALSPSRRRLLGLFPLGLAGLSLFFLGARLLPSWQAALTPPEALLGVTEEITPTNKFYVISKNFSDPRIEESGWSLNLRGLLKTPTKLNLSQLQALSSLQQVVTMECVSNNVGGPLISTGVFGGLPLRSLLSDSLPEANTIVFTTRDNYTETLPLNLVMNHPEIMLALTLNGQPLSDRHGYPARIITPGHYGIKSPKWLTSIELINGSKNGYWENQGWDSNAVIKTTSRIDSHVDGQSVKLGPTLIHGLAFAGERGINSVEVSTDGGRSFQAANLRQPLAKRTWTLWSYPWSPTHSGPYTLQVRATDGDGKLQSSLVSPSFPDGASGYHSVRVNLAR